VQRGEAAGRTNCVCDGILGLVEIAGGCHQLHVQGSLCTEGKVLTQTEVGYRCEPSLCPTGELMFKGTCYKAPLDEQCKDFMELTADNTLQCITDLDTRGVFDSCATRGPGGRCEDRGIRYNNSLDKSYFRWLEVINLEI